MADSRQFGGPKIRQFGDKTSGDRPGDSGHCAQCEAMLADALDGTLSAEEQELFDGHMAECGPCAQALADARRGVAFLEMLRHPQPEPPAALLERILAQTSGMEQQAAAYPGAVLTQAPGAYGAAAMAQGYMPGAAGKVLPFPQRMTAVFRRSSFAQVILQPRLAMTAAMAFFSITLTLNLTGVRLQDLRASDLKPSSLKRSFYSAKARSVQYYEGLRVVYELESRVHDLQNGADADPAGNAPAATRPSESGTPPKQNTDDPNNPSAKPDEKKQPQRSPTGPASRQMPQTGTSRRDGLRQTMSLAAMVRDITTQPQPLGQMSEHAAHFEVDGVEGILV